MEEEGVVMPPPPILVVDQERVVHPPPVVVEEEEEEVVQPPPLVEEEVVVVQPPPVMVVDEEVVVQPPPMLEEEDEGVAVQEAPDAHALLLAQWVTETLGHAEHYRHLVPAGVDYVIACSQAARVMLLEVAPVLLQEPIDAADTIYTDLLEAVSRGMNSLLIGPAANIVDTLFNWPGPLAGAIDDATVFVHDFFYYTEPEGGPLDEARRELGYLVNVVHADAGHLFRLYADTLGLAALPGGEGAYDLWVLDHDHADTLARQALQMLNDAVERSLAAYLAVRLCGIMPASRVRPGAGPLLPVAALRLQQTIDAVDDVLVVLHEMRDTLQEVEQDVFDVTVGQDPPPP